MIIPW